MRRANRTLVGLVVVAALAASCGEPPPVQLETCSAGWSAVASAPDDLRLAAERSDLDVENVWDVPLSAVTGVAISPDGTVVGGVSAEDDLFWDAWVVPSGGGSPRRLAPIGDALVSVDASGALWTTVAAVDASGKAAHEVRLSPSDGAPSVALSPDLPPELKAERAVADGEGGRLLIGSEALADGATHGSVFAVAADGKARRLACDERPNSPLILTAALAPDALYLAVQYAPDGPPEFVRVPRR